MYLENGRIQVIPTVSVKEPEQATQPTVLEATESWVEELNAAHGHEKLSYEIDNVGKAYIRIAMTSCGQRSVYGFVKVSDGSIWKAASWKAPAKNFSRGNVFGNRQFHWTSVA